MAKLRSSGWQKLPISLTELCIDTTLRCGQSFRWRKSSEDVWSCALHGRILSLRQDSTHLHYRALFPAHTAPLTPPASSPVSEASTGDCTGSAEISDDTSDDTLDLIRHYLNLEPNLAQLYAQWSAADRNFRAKAPKFTGVRILRQDAWEALVCFICSSNNNIARITQMVDNLCRNYGRLLGHLDGQPYHDFPDPHMLAGVHVESHLRQLGFGYRAKYLYETARLILDVHEEGWLDSLRNPESPPFGKKAKPAGDMPEDGRAGYRGAHEALIGLKGVGPKVADCVCLMGLGWGEAVPVDTHVWQIAQRDYKFRMGKHSSLTKAVYDAVGNKFRSLWGKEAGWAHSVLFTADLRVFSERLAQKLEREKVTTEMNDDSDGKENVHVEVKNETILQKRVKPEFDDIEHPVLEVHQDMMSRIKRRRR